MEIKPIAIYRCPFHSKFGVPRQSGVVKGIRGRIVFEKEFADPSALRGLEGFDYVWLIWGFSANREGRYHPTVRPPRMGGDSRVGVFATRSPFRPNPLGLSCVRIDRVVLEGSKAPCIEVLGADLMDGTPIYDIKPYLPYTDSHPQSRGGFVDSTPWKSLGVVLPPSLRGILPPYEERTLLDILSEDPRPRYHDDPERVYGMPFAGKDIHFKVEGDVLTVVDISELEKPR